MNNSSITMAYSEERPEDFLLFVSAMGIRESQTKNASFHNCGGVFDFHEIPRKRRSRRVNRKRMWEALIQVCQRECDRVALTMTPSEDHVPGLPAKRVCRRSCYVTSKEEGDGNRNADCKQQRSIKKPRRSMKSDSNESIPAIPGWLETLVRDFGGSEIKFVMKKQLKQCDLSANNNRLSIPERQIRQEFLTDEEKKTLSTRDKEGKSRRSDKEGTPVSIDVQVVDPCMREHTVRLKRWEMRSSITFNLTGKWKEVVKINSFRENQILNIWCCRNRHCTLTFLLIPLPEDLALSKYLFSVASNRYCYM